MSFVLHEVINICFNSWTPTLEHELSKYHKIGINQRGSRQELALGLLIKKYNNFLGSLKAVSSVEKEMKYIYSSRRNSSFSETP